MSLGAIMNSALTGLFTNQAALRVTSNNIANVNTVGYVRQVVRQEPIADGVGGVRIAGIDRIVDKFLDEAVLTNSAHAARYTVERQFHDRIQAFIGRPDSQTNLSARLDNMFQRMGALSQDPSKQVLRQDVLSGIENFSNELSRLADEIQSMRADASYQIAERIRKANAALERIDALNPLIVKQTVLGQEAGPLIEQRSQALAELGNLIDIRSHDQGDGSIHITTSNGTVLLSGSRYQLKYTSPGTATSETVFSSITAHAVDPISKTVDPNGIVLDGTLLGGEIKGLLNLRDLVLPDMANELGRLGGSVIDRINAAHNASSAFPPPNSLIGRNSGILATDLHGFSGASDFLITDSAGAVIEKVTVDFSAMPAGSTIQDVINAVNAGLASGSLSLSNGVMSFSANAGLGVAIVDDPSSSSDRGGRGFSHFFGMNDLMQAKVPTIYQTGFQGTDNHGFTAGGTVSFEIIGSDNRQLTTYTLTIAAGDFNSILSDLNSSTLSQYATFSLDGDGALVVTPVPGFESTKINVQSDSSQRGASSLSFSRMFGIGTRYLADQASGVGVVSAVSTTPNRLAVGRIEYGVGVGQVAIGASNGDGAKALQAVELMVNSFPTTGKIGAISGTLAQYSAAILSNMGLLAQDASSREVDTQALVQELSNRRNEVSGVNLDEELSNMVIYQNSYNASARVISAVRELYDALLAVV
jgi:flagellar hook-associated protein 1 FlgK